MVVADLFYLIILELEVELSLSCECNYCFYSVDKGFIVIPKANKEAVFGISDIDLMFVSCLALVTNTITVYCYLFVLWMANHWCVTRLTCVTRLCYREGAHRL